MSKNSGSSSQQGSNTGNQGKPPSYGTQNVSKGDGIGKKK